MYIIKIGDYMNQVIFKNISKIYNQNSDNEVRALDDVSFEIPLGASPFCNILASLSKQDNLLI